MQLNQPENAFAVHKFAVHGAANTRAGRALAMLTLAAALAAVSGGCRDNSEPPQFAPQTSTQISTPGNPDQNLEVPKEEVQDTPDTSISDATDTTGNAQFSLVHYAVAELAPASGSSAKGTVTFKPDASRHDMVVEVNMSGLTAGKHGFHIHELGDCSAPDAESAGAHFDPYKNPHASPEAERHHVGDMGNLVADDNGEVKTTLEFRDLALSGPANIINKAVIIHALADDLNSQPGGASGARVACGVIRADQTALANPAGAEPPAENP